MFMTGGHKSVSKVSLPIALPPIQPKSDSFLLCTGYTASHWGQTLFDFTSKLGQVLFKGGLISESCSLWLKSPKVGAKQGLSWEFETASANY